MNERTNKRNNEWKDEQTNERTYEKIEWMSKRMNETVIQSWSRNRIKDAWMYIGFMNE